MLTSETENERDTAGVIATLEMIRSERDDSRDQKAFLGRIEDGDQMVLLS